MKFRDLEKGTLGGRTEDFDVGGRVVKIRVVPLLAGRDGEIERGRGFTRHPCALSRPIVSRAG